MARISRPLKSAIASVVLALALGVSFAAVAEAADVCDPGALLTCPQVAATTKADTVHGWLLVPDQGQTAKHSAARHGCSDCAWTLTTKCITDTGYSGPGGDHCAGTYVGCRPTELRYLVYLSTPDSGTQLVSQYCRADGTGAVSQADVLPDIRDYLDQISVAKPTISAWPPDGRGIVNVPTYFAAAPAQAGDQTFGGAGFTMDLGVTPATYEWAFGDGQALSTAEPGGAPPGGSVRHIYRTSGQRVVTLTVTYGATYTVRTPVGALGPLAVPGGPVVSAPAAMPLAVDESIATLTH